MKNPWQPIETAPNDGNPFQVWMPLKHLNSHIHTATFHPNIKIIGGLFAFDMPSQPTHWAPFLEPPDSKDYE